MSTYYDEKDRVTKLQGTNELSSPSSEFRRSRPSGGAVAESFTDDDQQGGGVADFFSTDTVAADS